MRVLGIVVAVLVVVGLLFLVHWYLWRRLARDTTGSRPVRVGAAVVLALLALSVPVALATSPRYPALSLIGYLWLAVLFYLLLALVVTELLKPLARKAFRHQAARHQPAPAADEGSQPEATKEEPEDPGRRLLVARAAAIVAGLAVAGTVGSGVHSALGAPRIRRVRITLAKLPRSREGYRIALVSDIHLGPLSGRSRTERIVDLINGLDVDAVAICGDLVDGSVAQLGRAAEPLSRLRSRQGSYFVTGNHEYFSGYLPWVEEVASLGVRPLRNERVDLSGLLLAGVNDATGKAHGDPADYGKALDGRDTSVPVVLLAHQPVQIHEAAKHGVDLQLSGHTHGGQMVPFNAVVRAVQPVVSGYARIDGTQLFVTNGAGFWGPPVRVGAPPDITLVELHAP